jgi:hypothetical protein
MLVVKGVDVGFDLSPTRGCESFDVERRDDGWMHDASGRDWPRCSILIGPFKEGPIMKRAPRDAVEWFGDDYTPHEGRVTLPPREKSEWVRVDVVQRIYYRRTGAAHPYDFEHEFGRRRIQVLFRKGKLPILMRRGRFYRLDMQAGCVIDARGIVFP